MDQSNSLKKTHLTKDGSHTFYIEALDEYYHSIHGAIQESETVFINAGLNAIDKNEISIFEMGFGTGLNALMTFLEAEKKGLKINYYTIEAYPISIDEARLLNYHKELNAESNLSDFLKMHECLWDENIQISKSFTLHKIKGEIENLNTTDFPKIDLIYFDAFAPSAQPHLWEKNILQLMCNLLNTNGILTTYCAKGVFKRTLKEIGFTIESLPGPIGKREITRAIKY
jgi:tRNA U34 5-methylaminomethyl-2-thiouridine-forming methyltransferase MnmC